MRRSQSGSWPRRFIRSEDAVVQTNHTRLHTLRREANNSDDVKHVKVVDLSDSLAQLYEKDPRVTALFPNGSPPKHLEPQVINGIHLLGLDSAFFKDHEKDEDKTLQPAANTATSQEIDLIDGNIQPGSVYLVFTHIPDMMDPFPQPDGKLKSSWKFHDEATLPGKTTTRDKWINILKKPEILGLTAWRQTKKGPLCWMVHSPLHRGECGHRAPPGFFQPDGT